MLYRSCLLITSLMIFSSSLIIDQPYEVASIYDDGDDDHLKEAVPHHFQHRHLSSNSTNSTSAPSLMPSESPSAYPTAAPSRKTAAKNSQSGISSWEIGVGVAILLASTICILLSILAIKISLDFHSRHPRELHVDLDEETGTGMNISTTNDKATLLPPKPPKEDRAEYEKPTFGIAMMDKNPHRGIEYHTPPPPGGLGRNSTGSYDFLQYEKFQKGHRKQTTL